MKFLAPLLDLRLLLLVTGSISLAACNKEENDKFVKFPVKGTVQLLDEYGRPETDNSGVDIRVYTDLTKDNPTVSNAAGSYTQSAYKGKQLFYFAKKDYAEFLLYDQPVDAAHTVLPKVTLARMASASVTNLAIVERNDTLFISGRMTKPSSPGLPRQHRIFFIQHNFGNPHQYRMDWYWIRGEALESRLNSNLVTISGTTNSGEYAFIDTLAVKELREKMATTYPPGIDVVAYGDNLSAISSPYLWTGINAFEVNSYTGKHYIGGTWPALSRDSSNIVHYTVR
ncbi:hypothetical protein [Hymenobacter sp. BT730]|uniref:hypothetical protein n=1 Tax=Hymenobacter sp. BT730 TaxID=3063332 RepID=UPI0026DF9F14|nr:hypothetical protein [Hymenobacter sp. BT730]